MVAILRSIDQDFKDNHRIALPAVKVAMQAIILQMRRPKEWGDAKYNALDSTSLCRFASGRDAAIARGSSNHANFLHPRRSSIAMKTRTSAHLTARLFDEPLSFNVIAGHLEFRSKPELYAAFLAALKEAPIHQRDKRKGRSLLKVSVTSPPRRLLEVRRSRDLYNQARRIGPFVNFMAKVGYAEKSPADWRDISFPRRSRRRGDSTRHARLARASTTCFLSR